MSNLEIFSATHGIAPRSDELLRIGGDVERGRLDPVVFEDKLAEEEEEWRTTQKNAGIDFYEDGKLAWQDHLRPIVKATSGFADDVDNAPVTRWFDTNTFYRQPTITGPLTFNPAIFEELVGQPGNYVSVLAPYSFSRLVDNQSDIDPQENVYRLYEQLLGYYVTRGVGRVVLEETFDNLVERIFDQKPKLQLIALAEKFPELQINNIPTRGGTVAIPLNVPLNLGFEFGNGSINHLYRHIPGPYRPNLFGREIWQPVVDASTTAPDIVDVKQWSRNAYHQISPGRLVLTHTVDLERLPLSHAQTKVRELGELSVILKEHFEEELL